MALNKNAFVKENVNIARESHCEELLLWRNKQIQIIMHII